MSAKTVVTEMKSKADYDKLLKETVDKLIVVDFTAIWCGPCKKMKPIFETIANDHPDVVFIKVDVDACEEISSDAGISCMPTFHYYRNGVKVEEFSGANESKLREYVEKHK